MNKWVTAALAVFLTVMTTSSQATTFQQLFDQYKNKGISVTSPAKNQILQPGENLTIRYNATTSLSTIAASLIFEYEDNTTWWNVIISPHMRSGWTLDWTTQLPNTTHITDRFVIMLTGADSQGQIYTGTSEIFYIRSDSSNGGMPDLTVSHSTGGTLSYKGGASVSIPISVTNSGSVKAVPSFESYFDTTAYISTSPSVNWNGLGENASIAESAKSFLNANSSYSTTLRFQAPSTAGTYYVRVKADDFDCVDESNESNNWSDVIVLNVTSSIVSGPSVQVTLKPEQVTSQARWYVGFVSPYEGPYESGYEFAHDPGGYQHQYIYFNNVPGWKTPTRISYDIRGTQRYKFTAEYEPLYPMEVDVAAEIQRFGGKDFDGDGYFDTYAFNLAVTGTALYGDWDMKAKVIASSGQVWWLDLDVAEEGRARSKTLRFKNDDFVGHVPSKTDLTFTVELWDKDGAQRYASADTILNGPIKTEAQTVNLAIKSIQYKLPQNTDQAWHVGDGFPVEIYLLNKGSVQYSGSAAIQLWACEGSAINESTDCLLGNLDKRLNLRPNCYTRITFSKSKTVIPPELGTGQTYNLAVRIVPEQRLQSLEIASDNTDIYQDVLQVSPETYDLAVSFIDVFRTSEIKTKKIKDRASGAISHILSVLVTLYNLGTVDVDAEITVGLSLMAKDGSHRIGLEQITDNFKRNKNEDKKINFKNASLRGISGDYYLYAEIEPAGGDDSTANNTARSLYLIRIEDGLLVDMSDWCNNVAGNVKKLKAKDIEHDISSSVTLADARAIINGDYDDFGDYEKIERSKNTIIGSLNSLYKKNSDNASFLWTLSIDFDMQLAAHSSFNDKKLHELLNDAEALLEDVISETDPYAKAILTGKLRYYQREIQRELFLMHAIMRANSKQQKEALEKFNKLSRTDYIHARIPMPTTNTSFGNLYDDINQVYQLVPQLTAIANEHLQQMILDVSMMPLEAFMEGTMGLIGEELGIIGDLVSFPVSIYKYGTIQKKIVQATEEIGLGLMDEALVELKNAYPFENEIEQLLSDADERLTDIDTYLN